MRKVGSTTDTADANGEYTNGNVANGVLPTIINAEMLNTFQREMVNVVEGLGYALNPDDDSQILKAIEDVTTGRLIDIKVFYDSGTYTKSEGTKSLVVEIIAGGGGSKSITADSSSTGGSQPGCSGQYNKSRFDAKDVPSSVSVTIGSGGTPGNAGAQSSFGSLVSVAGGSAGANGMASAGAFISGNAYRYTGLVNTSEGVVLASSGGEAQTPQVMQVSAGTATGFIAYLSQFPGGQFGRGADGRYAGAGMTVNGLAGNKGICIVYEFS